MSRIAFGVSREVKTRVLINLQYQLSENLVIEDPRGPNIYKKQIKLEIACSKRLQQKVPSIFFYIKIPNLPKCIQNGPRMSPKFAPIIRNDPPEDPKTTSKK